MEIQFLVCLASAFVSLSVNLRKFMTLLPKQKPMKALIYDDANNKMKNAERRYIRVIPVGCTIKKIKILRLN